ncbi:MAG TPA: TraB/GumN family protein [Acidiferrobacteraceae bacterium]|nr:TraB/GumN family protein [Acidiferrobacteraceae bacterium]
MLSTASAGASCTDWNAFPQTPLLWRLDGPHGPAGFVLGTMHSDAPSVLATAVRLKPLLVHTQVFVMETLLTPAAVATLTDAMRLPNGTLASLVGPRLYLRTTRALARRGIAPAFLQNLKPWAAMLLLGSPIAHGPVLDAALATDAQEANVPVRGLETTAEQIQVLDKLPLTVQIDLLRQTLAQQGHGDNQALREAYLRNNLRALIAVADRGEHQPGDRIFYRRLLHDRNRRMARRAVALLAHARAFIAVGALHLPGLLRRLASAGYCATPVADTPE